MHERGWTSQSRHIRARKSKINIHTIQTQNIKNTRTLAVSFQDWSPTSISVCHLPLTALLRSPALPVICEWKKQSLYTTSRESGRSPAHSTPIPSWCNKKKKNCRWTNAQINDRIQSLRTTMTTYVYLRMAGLPLWATCNKTRVQLPDRGSWYCQSTVEEERITHDSEKIECWSVKSHRWNRSIK